MTEQNKKMGLNAYNKKTKIGLIGLGYMGRPIANNFLRRGFLLNIYARRNRVKKEMKAMGARIAATPKLLAEQSDIIFLVVTDSKAVTDLIFGENGILAGATRGTIVVDMTTSDPKFSSKIAQQLSKEGIEYLDAPISGGALGAEKGRLLTMVGGKMDVYKRCIPVFKAFSKKIIYVGKSGSAHLIKIIHNLLSQTTFLANCEAVALGEKLGLSAELMNEIFNHGNARSYSTEIRFPRFILSKTYNMGSTVATNHKDMAIAHKVKKRAGLKLPITSGTYNYYKRLMKEGEEGDDISKMLLKIKALSER